MLGRTLVFVLIFLSKVVYAQQDAPGEIENLINEDYDYLSGKVYENENNKELQLFYAKAYLEKAKMESSIKDISNGYYFLGVLNDDRVAISYYDSVISTGKKHDYYEDLPYAYLEKGNVLYENSDYEEAFENYLSAKKKADSIGTRHISIAANDNIGSIKEMMGEYAETLEIYKENYNYWSTIDLKGENIENYFSTLHSLAFSFVQLKNTDSSSYYSKLGYGKAVKMNNDKYKAIFGLMEGINLFGNGKNNIAQDSLKRTIPHFNKVQDSLNLAISYLYLGKIFLKKKDTTQAVTNLMKADSLLENQNSIIPIYSEIYELLWKNSFKNPEIQLKYLTKYLEKEAKLKKEFKVLYPSIKRKYDLPKLVEEKENLISKLNSDSRIKSRTTIILIALLGIVGVFAIYYFNKQKYYKKRFNQIINEKKSTLSKQKANEKEIDIQREVIHDIIKKLESFESNNIFLKNDITLQSLATKFGTNTNYLSKIVNHYKGKNFSKYLSELRIDYIIEELKVNKRLRDYTIKAIAVEAGFNNSESFTKAFHEKTKLYPSYFVKNLKKIYEN